MNIQSIKCIKCQAPVAWMGNQARCLQLVCDYCGTVMDTKNEFKSLYTYSQIIKFHMPLATSLSIKNVTYVITAYIAYESRNNQWIEYQLFSKTHGYAKLIDKNNKKIFFTKSHYLPNKNIWMLNQKDRFTCQNIEFKIVEFQHAEIYYASGSLIESIKQGQRNKQCFAECNDQYFHSVYSRHEVKNYKGIEIT